MRHTSIRFKVFVFLFLASLGSCNSKAQVYNDLDDYGYSGKIKSINTRTYYRIAQVQNKWQITDTTAYSLIHIKFFNEDGNFTKRIVINNGIRNQYVYDYSNHEKIGWTKFDINGNVIGVGKFTYKGEISFTESEYDTSGVKEFESIYTLDKTQRTKTLEDVGYTYDSHKWGMETRVTFHLFTVFQDRDAGGLYKVTTQDKLRNTIDDYEFEIIERDKFGNPVAMLVKQNGKPKEIRISTIDYLVK